MTLSRGNAKRTRVSPGLLFLSPGLLFLSSACSFLQYDIRNGGPPGELRARCATAAVVGLSWRPPPASGSHVAGYEIYRDDARIGATTSAGFADTAVVGATLYRYGVVALDHAGRASAPAALAITTAVASPNGDPAYCHSQTIGSLTWHWSRGYTQADGSDLWPPTWGRDGNVYLAFGDGGGFGGSNALGRTSFGIAMVAGKPPLEQAALRNIYGGYDALRPATLSGKASSIIAVGKNFYALGGIYRPTDAPADYPHQPSGSPNRVEIAYSMGNAYSWHTVPWTFCGADATGKQGLSGSFCPMSFVNYGPGNAGAPGHSVYLVGTGNSVFAWAGGVAPLPLKTYLAKVSPDRVRDHSAYRYFAGLDRRGHPIWSPDQDRAQPIFTDRNAPQAGCDRVCNMAGTLGEIVYDAGLERYIGIAQGDYLAQTAVYDAPNPWGPWTSISYDNIAARTGTGGWANLGAAAGASLGLHPVNAWTSADGMTLWLTFSSDGKAPADALFPSAGAAMDSFNLVSVSLNLSDDSHAAHD